jgi:hypothetical protein
MSDTDEPIVLEHVLDERVPEELRQETDHAGHPLSVEQWEQLDRWFNPPEPEPAALTPASPEHQYVLDCLTGAGTDEEGPVWWPTWTPAEFGRLLEAVAVSDQERWMAQNWETLHGPREFLGNPFDENATVAEPSIGRPAAEVEAEEAAAGLNAGHDPVTTLVDEDDSEPTPAGPPLPPQPV